MGKKIRLDLLLVEKGLIDTREKAKRMIMAGMVFSEEQRLDKPGQKVDESIPVKIKGKVMPYVSRGGMKLEKALKTFPISVEGKIMIDIGASTGGFTDCALQHGAKASYAIDVGYNQLDWKLRNDERVHVMERTNFRYVTQEDLTMGSPTFATIDVSFISLTLILPVLAQLLNHDSSVIALIKPQFEAGRNQVGKKGIVREAAIHREVIEKIVNAAGSLGYTLEGLTYSPITGGDGNIEFLAYFHWDGAKEGHRIDDVELNTVVSEAHEAFKSIRN
ncbi:TlyA family RNA methyltransferase [Thalassobacillus sp. CUG 92003]|uniref:TlyA family RNA methyltransferase n=1 Tax=Thalassobacillus sp. CUG 92003 TaxID=2736641 RepID=UPI0015E67B87|nr:TlyA family RNA methyltransferase [Thalassobacillus sp. CUG 92003]